MIRIQESSIVHLVRIAHCTPTSLHHHHIWPSGNRSCFVNDIQVRNSRIIPGAKAWKWNAKSIKIREMTTWWLFCSLPTEKIRPEIEPCGDNMVSHVAARQACGHGIRHCTSQVMWDMSDSLLEASSSTWYSLVHASELF